MSAPVRLDVFSDYLCPWCYNAAVRLSEVEEEYGDRIRVHWRAFPIIPDEKPGRLATDKTQEGRRRVAAEEPRARFAPPAVGTGLPASSMPALIAAKCAERQVGRRVPPPARRPLPRPLPRQPRHRAAGRALAPGPRERRSTWRASSRTTRQATRTRRRSPTTPRARPGSASPRVPAVIFNEKVSLVGAVPVERYRAILDWILAGEPGGLVPIPADDAAAGATQPGARGEGGSAMLSSEDNELLCRVGPGTPMGDLMRQYWIPALLSGELPAPDCPPVRVRLLGENLIAFRATSGEVGLIQNACPHRGASLFFGRNEEEGLRCVYHGWKFDVHRRLRRHAVRAGREQLQEQGAGARLPVRRAQRHRLGLHGPAATAAAAARPRGQHAGSTASTRSQKVLARVQLVPGPRGRHRHRATWASCTSAPSSRKTRSPARFDYYNVADRAPRYDVVDTDFGTSYGAYRPAEADTYYWRIAHFLFPFYTMIPTGILGVQVLVRAWVPVDDEHVMFWSIASAALARGPGEARAARPG